MKHARNAGPDLAYRLGRRMVSVVADDMSTTQRVTAGIVAALVAISPFGAWSEVAAQADPLVTGTPVEVGPFEVTVLKASTADELAYLVPKQGNHLLAVVADVTNIGTVPEYSSTLGRAIPAPKGAGIVPEVPLDQLGADTATADTASPGPSPSPAPEEPEEPELPSATIFNIEDATNLSILNPGVTYRVALVWEQSGEWAEQAVPLELVELEWVEEDPQGLDDGHWFADRAAFQGQLQVKTAEPAADTEPATNPEPANAPEPTIDPEAAQR